MDNDTYKCNLFQLIKCFTTRQRGEHLIGESEVLIKSK